MRVLVFALCLLLLTGRPAAAALPGPKLAFVRGGDLWLLSDGRERRLTHEGGGVSNPRLSYDGRFVAYRQGRFPMVTGTDGSGPWPLPGGGPGRWNPQENTLTLTDGRSLSVVAVTGRGPGAPQLIASGWAGGVWSPDGLWLAVSRGEPSERSMFEGTAHVGLVSRMPLSWSPDGQWLLLVRGGKVHPLGLSPNVHWAVWAPRGARLAYVDGAGRSAASKKRLRLAAAPWEQPAVTVTPDGYADREPAWRPDGQTIAFTRSSAQGRSQIYRLGQSRPVADGFCPFWGADGSLYWLTAADGGQASVDSERGVVVRGVDMPAAYYGQWACERVLSR